MELGNEETSTVDVDSGAAEVQGWKQNPSMNEALTLAGGFSIT